MINWTWHKMAGMTTDALYEMFKVRQEVFVVEQNCAFLDLDGEDQEALHLLGRAETDQGQVIAAYLRVLPPGKRFDTPSIGRLLTVSAFRRQGLGRACLRQAIDLLQNKYPGVDISLSSQEYLVSFYERAGFEKISEVYDEDGIPHCDMVLKG